MRSDILLAVLIPIGAPGITSAIGNALVALITMERMHMPELGDAPIEEKYLRKMTAICAALDVLFNGEACGPDREVGFVLLVFPFGDEGRCNFISNGADRGDIVVLFKEMISRFEGQAEISGHA